MPNSRFYSLPLHCSGWPLAPALRHLADDMLPELRQHLQDARALQSSLFGKENEKR